MSGMKDMDSTMKDYLEDIAENAKNEIKPEDYIGEDGLLHCGVCHMPKEQRYERGIMGKTIKRSRGQERKPAISKNCFVMGF